MKSKEQLSDNDISKVGSMMTGSQLVAILQTIYESSAVRDEIEFTPTITFNNLETFTQRVLSLESIQKIQFGVINVESNNKKTETSLPPDGASAEEQQDEMPGEHWVSYIQIPSLFDEEGNVIGVRSIILNSADEIYNTVLNQVRETIISASSENKVNEFEIKHLNYQEQDIIEYGDWNTCGIWVCYYFEQTIRKMINAENSFVVKFDEVIDIDITQKRHEYSGLLKALDVSTNPTTSVNKILDMESTETDSILEGIDKELSEKYSINTEELDLDKLLSHEDIKESIPSDNILSPILNSAEAKELITTIKDKVNPPILDEETELARDQRLATLTKAFIDLAKLYIGKADSYDGDEIKQTKIQYYTEAAKLLNYALSIRQDIVDKTVITSSEENRKIYYTIELTLEELNRKFIDIVGGDISKAKIASAIKNTILDKADLEDLRDHSRKELEEIDKLLDEEKTPRTRALFEHITNTIKSYLARVYQESEIILGTKPCEYTVIGLGSMALNQMTPYSDLEFAILTANDKYKNDPELKGYFEDLTHLVNFRIINLGETVIHEKNIDGALIYDLVHRGVNLDLGGKTPIPVPGKPELIQTVDNMLIYLKNQEDNLKWLDTSSILEATCYVYGNNDLYNAYQQGIDQFLFHETSKDGKSNYQIRALQRLKEGVIEKGLSFDKKGTIGNIEEFAPKLSGQGNEGKLFDVKHEIYRLPDRFLYNLALLYNAQPNSAWDAIDHLQAQDIISLDGATYIRSAVTFATRLRLRIYLYYERQQENLYIFERNLSDEEIMQNKIRLYLFENKLTENGEIFKYYYTVLPLYKQLEDLCNKYNTLTYEERNNFFQIKSFYDDSNRNKSLIYRRLAKYKKVITYLEKVLESQKCTHGEVHAEVAETLAEIGNSYKLIEQHKAALGNLEEALRIYKIIYNDEHSPEIHSKMAAAFYQVGNIYRYLGKFQDSLNNYKHALLIHKEIYGAFYTDITITTAIGEIYSFLGDYQEALNIYTRALLQYKIIYGEESVYVAYIMNNIAHVCSALGKNQEALDSLAQSLRVTKIIYGNINSNVAIIFSAIGGIYFNLGRYKDTSDYYMKALQIYKTIFDEENPNVANILCSIGNIHQVSGKYQDSLTYYIKGLNIFKWTYGERHPEVAILFLNIGTVYQKLGKYQEGLENYKHSLRIFKENFGEMHPYIADVTTSIGLVYQILGRNKESLENHQCAFKINKQFYGEKHPKVALVATNIGGIYQDLGKYQEALESYKYALRINEVIYRKAHPDVARIINNIAGVYQDTGKYQEALDNFNYSLKINEELYGKNHPDVAVIIHNVGLMYYKLEKNEKALDSFACALKIFKEFYGETHSLAATTNVSIGNVYQVLGKYQKALEYYLLAIQVFKECYGEKHTEFAKVTNNIGAAYQALGKDKEALKYYQKALSIHKSIYGEMHPNVATNINNIGVIYANLGRNQEAFESFQHALLINKAIYGEIHPDVAQIINSLGNLHLVLGEYQNALEKFQQALLIQKKIFSEDQAPIKYTLDMIKQVKIFQQFNFYMPQTPSTYLNRKEHEIVETQINCVKELKHQTTIIKDKIKNEEYKKIDIKDFVTKVEKHYGAGFEDTVCDKLRFLREIYERFKDNFIKKDLLRELILDYAIAEVFQEKRAIDSNLIMLFSKKYKLNIALINDDIQQELKLIHYHYDSKITIYLGYIQSKNHYFILTRLENYKFNKLVKFVQRESIGLSYKNNIRQYIETDIGSRILSGFKLDDIGENSDSFYKAIIRQMKLCNYHFAQSISHSIKPHDELKQLIQGNLFKEQKWNDEDMFIQFAYEFPDLILAILDSRKPDNGFRCYYLDERGIIINNNDLIMPERLVLKIVATGDYFLSVISHPKIYKGSITQAQLMNEDRFLDLVFDDLEIKYIKEIIYTNPLIHYGYTQEILKMAIQIGGPGAINKLIALGEDSEVANSIIEATKEYGIKHVLNVMLLTQFTESDKSAKNLESIANSIESKTLSLSTNSINDRFIDQSEFASNNDFIKDNFASTFQTDAEINQKDQLNLQALILASFAIKEMIESAATLKYFTYEILDVQYILPQKLQEIELPEFTKKNYFWVAMHYVAGTIGSFSLPTSDITLITKIATPIASTSVYGAKLAIYDSLKEQKQIAMQSGEGKSIDNPRELIEKCGLDMAAYSALSLISGGINKVILGIMPLSIIAYDIFISATLGGIQCYSAYQQVNNKENQPPKTTLENILPSVVDAIALYTATKNIHSDFSSAYISMMSVKQSLEAIGTAVITDQIAKLFLSANREAIKNIETNYLESSISYVSEILNERYVKYVGEQGVNDDF